MQITGELITGNDFRRMIISAYQTFMRDHEYINSLNIFPVPDGDTGTNMMLTLSAAARAVKEAADNDIGVLSKQVADSAIMGARGNSGVILSQILRGLARGLAGKECATSAEMSKAFQYGVLYAYRSVSRPVEGTILTVSKGIAKGAHRAVRDNLPFEEVLASAIAGGEKELARTPELLPILKAAGVVDAGGKGLIVFLTGCLAGLTGENFVLEADIDKTITAKVENKDINLEHPYCTEFLIKNCTVSANEARKCLINMGESLVVAEGSELLKVHIHTASPGKVLDYALSLGTLHDIKIDNMADQHRETLISAEPTVDITIISVAAGEGIANIMKQLGAGIIIMGGQTLNPPVEDFVNAIKQGTARKYIILPNNKNIMLAAAQVQKLMGDKVEIVPTVNVAQGLAALVAFSDTDDITTNLKNMQARIGNVKGAAVTVAVRDSLVDGQKVAAGKIIGVVDSKVLVYADNLEDALVKMADKLLGPENEILSLYYGSELNETAAEELAAKLKQKYPNIEIEVYYGGQPHYHFIISIE